MRLDAIAVGNNPPDDINVVVEVGIGGEPIKYEMNKAAGTLFVDRFCIRQCAIQATMALFRTPFRMMTIRLMCW